MRWTKIALVSVVCLSLLAWFIWPPLHQHSIRWRMVHAMHESGVKPGTVGMGFMSLAVHELDPPSYVLPVLWDLSTDLSDHTIAGCATYALAQIGEGQWSSSSFTREDWLDSLDTFVSKIESRGRVNEVQQKLLTFLKEKRELRQAREAGGRSLDGD